MERARTAMQLLGAPSHKECVPNFATLLGSRLDGAESVAVATLLAGKDALAAEFEFGDDYVEARTDKTGLSPVFYGVVDNTLVISNSVLVVAAARSAEFDPRAVGMLARVGFLVAGRTLFSGVHRLQAGQAVRLGEHDPRFTLSDATEPSSTPTSVGRDSVRPGADVLRTILDELLETESHPVLELSGGLDSRAVLAALPPGGRRGIRAVTLGAPDDPNVRVARSLADHCGLDWMHFDPVPTGLAPGRDLLEHAISVARQRNLCVSVPSSVALALAEVQMPTGPRLTGANGEFARGFYYVGTLPSGGVTRRRVERLAHWRLFTNEGSAATALLPDIDRDAEAATLSALEDQLGRQSAWRTAVDEFYLAGRMANWAGPGYATRPPANIALAPFFHSEFLQWARSLPQTSGARRRSFAQMVDTLDAPLARIPLDTGRVVSDMAHRGVASSARTSSSIAIKVAKKVDQRVRRRARPPSQSSVLALALAESWDETSTEALRGAGLFRPAVVGSLATGGAVDTNVLSLALNIVSGVTFLAEHAEKCPRRRRSGDARDVPH